MNDWKIQGFLKTDKLSCSAHRLVPIGDWCCLLHSVRKINEENSPPATWRTVQAFSFLSFLLHSSSLNVKSATSSWRLTCLICLFLSAALKHSFQRPAHRTELNATVLPFYFLLSLPIRLPLFLLHSLPLISSFSSSPYLNFHFYPGRLTAWGIQHSQPVSLNT